LKEDLRVFNMMVNVWNDLGWIWGVQV
jgi:hypothetical protein